MILWFKKKKRKKSCKMLYIFYSSTCSTLHCFLSFVFHFLLPMALQIENEYGVQSKLFGAAGYNYMTWAANMAIKTGTGVPWVMCKEDDAPDPVVSSLALT